MIKGFLKHLFLLSILIFYCQIKAEDGDKSLLNGAKTAADGMKTRINGWMQKMGPIPVEELMVVEVAEDDPTKIKICQATVEKSKQACEVPRGAVFKEGLSIMSAGFGLTSGLLARGGASSQLSTVCNVAQGLEKVNSLTNKVRAGTCQNARIACANICMGNTMESLKGRLKKLDRTCKAKKIMNANKPKELANIFLGCEEDKDILRANMDFANTLNEECAQFAAQKIQESQQQVQANQKTLAQSMKACKNAFASEDSGHDEDFVDCLDVVNFGNHPSCSRLSGKTSPGSLLKGEPPLQKTIDPTPDFPNDPRALSKTGGLGNPGNPGMGSGGLLGGGMDQNSSSGKGSSQNKRRGSKKHSVLFGKPLGNQGNSSQFSHGDDDEGGIGSLGRLASQKGKIGMLTKRKLAASDPNQFGPASDDIWTRIYLRTNIRCAKQLKECSANRSRNPYGSSQGGRR